jgi:hypothetical protein
MLKKVFGGIILTCTLVFSATLKSGDTITAFSLPDQFDKVHQVNSKDYKLIIVAFEKDMAVMVNDYLKQQPENYLKEHNALFISDIHEMPSFVTKWFALPKMRKYKYSLLLIYDESNVFPKKDEAITVLKIKDNQIEKIDYISDEKNIGKIFN